LKTRFKLQKLNEQPESSIKKVIAVHASIPLFNHRLRVHEKISSQFWVLKRPAGKA
jgi:hypothetical protein